MPQTLNEMRMKQQLEKNFSQQSDKVLTLPHATGQLGPCAATIEHVSHN